MSEEETFIGGSGVIAFNGGRYWADWHCDHLLQAVAVLEGALPWTIEVWSVDRLNFLGTSQLISIVGREQHVVSREKPRAPYRRSGIRRLVAKLFGRSIAHQPIELRNDALSQPPIIVGQVREHGEQQEAQLADVVLMHAEAILVHAQAIIDAHDQLNSPSGRYAVSMRSAAKTLLSHRLSETSK